jgi:serine/threonine-protein kinase
MPRDRELSALLRGPDESVTYRQRGRSWTVVSGYRGDQIYYRRANLACGGARWHLIDLNYPASEKRRMDATVTYISRHLGSYRDVCPNR